MFTEILRRARTGVPRLLLSRRAVLGVMLALAAAVLLSFSLSEWVDVPAAGLPPVLRVLGFDDVLRAWWFLALAALAAVQLALVTGRLVRRDIRRIRRSSGPAAGDPIAVASREPFERALVDLRYRLVHADPATARYVKHPWGYLGPTALHAGMLLAMVSIVWMGLTTSSGLLTMAVGESLPAGTRLDARRQGPLGGEPALAERLTFDELAVTYWEDGEPRTITGTYTIGEPSSSRTISVSVNAPVTVGRVRYFQDQRYGYSFFITLDRGGSVERRRLNLPQPVGANVPSYEDITLANGDLLRAKMFVDEQAGLPPELTLRLVRGDDVLAEESFGESTVVTLGDRSVRIDGISRWSIIVLERGGGMWMLGLASFVMFAGALLIYVTPPREVTVVRHESGSTTAFWYAPRFGSILAPERARLADAAGGGKP